MNDWTSFYPTILKAMPSPNQQSLDITQALALSSPSTFFFRVGAVSCYTGIEEGDILVVCRLCTTTVWEVLVKTANDCRNLRPFQTTLWIYGMPHPTARGGSKVTTVLDLCYPLEAAKGVVGGADRGCRRKCLKDRYLGDR